MKPVTALRPVAALAGAILLAGCGFQFRGLPPSERAADPVETVREERGVLAGLFTRAPADLPDAVAVPAMRTAALERGYGGVILRATGVAPTQGYHGAALVAQNRGAPDAAGLVTVSLVAVPPEAPEAVGPERTRLLITAAYVPDRELRDIRGFRVVAGGNSVTLPLR